MNKLGTKVECPVPCEKSDDKESFPTASFRDGQMDEFLGDHKVDVDDEFWATVKMRVCGIRKDEYGKCLDVKIIESEDLALEPKKPAKEAYAE